MKCVATRSQVQVMQKSLHNAVREIHDFAILAEANCRDSISDGDRKKAEGMTFRISQNLIRLDRLLTVLENNKTDL